MTDEQGTARSSGEPVPARRRRRVHAGVALAVALPAGMVASGAMVWQASSAAFTATTVNGGNAWNTGKVCLSDDATGNSGCPGGASPNVGTALFSVNSLAPGSTGAKCITVTYDGTTAGIVKLYSDNVTGTGSGNLAERVQLVVKETVAAPGTAVQPNCTNWPAAPAASTTLFSGTLDGFAANAAFASGVGGSWTPTGAASDSRAYQITWTIDPNTPNALMSSSAGGDFAWEVNSTP
ncbi:hypothetical protein [Kineococcus glutinatus]|uniref:Ribosomally synthesized peptide with SipW-like signal peptide n=1 Tax=Kineococcus glutinatus TaxID=1070872 RepID=A0ABP9HUX2_9ACTN